MKKRPMKQIEDIQTGRTLPPGVKYYTPGRRSPPPPIVKPRRRFGFKKLLATLLLVIIIVAAVIGVWDARNISSASQKLFGTGNIFKLLGSGQLKGNDRGRVNLLLVGYSVDDPGHPGGDLTDSIMLLSMSTTAKNGYILSIPRDLYVKIPDFGYGKINEVYKDGGMDLLEQVISRNFDTPIDYYALINYATVRDTVNALHGITVNIKSSDPRGLYDPNISPADGGPLKLPNGSQKLDGQTALNLTRARGDAFGAYGFPQADFDRTQHQRQVLTAIKSKLSWKLVLTPWQNQQILNAVATNVKTNIKASEIRHIFGLFNSIPANQLQSLSLRSLNGHNYLDSTYYEGDTLTPAAGLNDYSDIQDALQQFDR